MARKSTNTGREIVWKYGCPSWASALLAEDAIAQFDMARTLYNDQVTVHRDYDEAREALWSQMPGITSAQAEVVAAGGAVSAAEDALKAERIKDRTTANSKTLRKALREAKAERAKAKEKVKDLKAEHRDSYMKRRAELDSLHRCRTGGCAKATCEHPEVPHPYPMWSAKGLAGSTITRTLDEVRAAVGAVIKRRKAGMSGKLSYRRRDDTGAITQQVGYGSVVHHSYVTIGEGRPREEWDGHPSHHGIPKNSATVTIRIGRSRDLGPLWIELPIVMHRPLPEGAQIRWVRIVRRWLAGNPILSVQLTLWVPEAEQVTEGATVAIKVGWSGVGDRWVRVATVATPDGPLPIPPPPEVAELVRTIDTTQEVCASPQWRDLFNRDDSIRSYRDELLDAVKTEVAAAFDADEKLAAQMAEALKRERLDVARWRSPGRMDRLAQAWPDDHVLKPDLMAWRARDRHLWAYEANERDQVVARRRDAYRKVAAWICRQARLIVVTGVDVKDLTAVPAIGDEDTHEARRARANRQWTAPGDFRLAVVQAAQRLGVTVVIETDEFDEEGDSDGADGKAA